MRAAAYCATRNLYPDLIPAIKSLIAHSDVEKIYLCIEDDTFPEWLPPCCEIVNVSGQQYFTPDSPNYHSKWTYMTLVKSLMTEFFPELDRILTLDVDTFVQKDIRELWRIDMAGKCLAGVAETKNTITKPTSPYINAGVIMQNLDHLRKSGKGAEVIKTLQRRRWPFPEQDAFNVVCEKSIIFLPREYNAGQGTTPYGAPIIRHFMGEGATYRKDLIYHYWQEMTWEAVLKK